MNNLREVAYLIDPALWVREVLGVEPQPWQEEFFKGAQRRIHSGADRAPDRQDRRRRRRRLGNGKCSLVHAWFAQRGRLPSATPER